MQERVWKILMKNSGTKHLCNKDASLLLVTDFRNTVIIFLMLFVSEKQKLLFN